MITRLLVTLLVAVVVTNGQLTQEQRDKFTESDVTIIDDGDYWEFQHDGIPDHDMGTFPGKGNPNEVSEQDHKFKIPKNPRKATEHQCLTMGPIAVATNGVPYFNPFTIDGKNAVEHESFDSCLGHPQQHGAYHYHQFSHCVPGATEVDAFVGVAFDGFPIYGPLTTGSNGNKNFTSADLDECHGREGSNGYEYRMSYDFPYILGCYRGTPTEMERPAKGNGMGPRPNDGRTPPPGVSRPPPMREGGDFNFCKADPACPNPIECGARTMAVSILVLLIGLVLSM